MRMLPWILGRGLGVAGCGGHGICALISGERIGLDAWGFAVVDPTVIDVTTLRRRARRAVAACPRGALSIEDGPDPSGTAAALG